MLNPFDQDGWIGWCKPRYSSSFGKVITVEVRFKIKLLHALWIDFFPRHNDSGFMTGLTPDLFAALQHVEAKMHKDTSIETEVDDADAICSVLRD